MDEVLVARGEFATQQDLQVLDDFGMAFHGETSLQGLHPARLRRAAF